MQRLFSTFADGWPGGGILLLRVLAGGALVTRGLAGLTGNAHSGSVLVEVIGAAAGLLILAGLWTPVLGILAGVMEAWIGFTQPGTQPSAVVLSVLGVSLAMIGPGAWSIDALLYGRKQILPPEP